LPTASPTCGVGSHGAPRHCGPCVPGEYTPIFDLYSCYLCPKGEYNNEYKASGCKRCTYPWYTVKEGESECNAIALRLTTFQVYAVGGVLTAMFFYTITHAGDMARLAFAIMILPAIDVFSDLIYILTSDFYNIWTFSLCVLFFCLPNFLFFYMVYEQNAISWVHRIFPGFLWKVKLLIFFRLDNRGLPILAENIDENGDPEKLWDPLGENDMVAGNKI
jgi:hypothetical protein